VKEGNRIARIVESLLSFARQEKDERTLTDLEKVLTDALTLMAAQLRKEAIAIEVDIFPDLPPVVVNTQKMQQVFVNLISNARYALLQKAVDPDNGLRLRISASTFHKGGQLQIRLVFDDNGTGIPADVIEKVINPFFSTKAKGHGTGLGLSISHGIITDHGGSLAVESEEGNYTRVTIELPAVTKKEGRLAS
jgi:C4-dicarboxylate-specific signal transduction histidine kinase